MIVLSNTSKYRVEVNPVKLLPSILLGLFFSLTTITSNAQFTYDNNYQNINFGGTGVSITYFPTGSNGTKINDIILYRNVVTLNGQAIDCYVTVEELSSGTAITTIDQTASSGNGWSFNSPRLFSPFMTMPSGTASNFGGAVSFRFQFIRGGTFTYNNITKVVSATNVTLQNVRINVYDIDGNGAQYSNQSARFGGFQTSEMAVNTNLSATYQSTTKLTSFRSKLSSNTTNALDDRNRVRVTYDALSNFVIRLTGAVTYYSFIDFGVGEQYTTPPVIFYQISGNLFNDANGLADNILNGTKLGVLDDTRINVNAVNSSNQVIANAQIADNGEYTLGAIPAGTYQLVLTDYITSLNSQLSSVVLPNNWSATGEFLGSGAGNDGLINGILTNVQVSTNSIVNANFSVNKHPEASNFSHHISTPILNSLQILGQGITSSLTGNDRENGTLGTRSKMAITGLPVDGNKLVYNGVVITTGLDGKNPPSETNPYIISVYDPTQLAVQFSGLNTTNTSFTYTVFDATGFKDLSPATYSLSWDIPLPVEFLLVSAILQSDNSVEIEWSTASELNNEKFEIQRMYNGETEFTKIGEINGAGTSNDIIDYQFTDDQINWTSGRAYYRIKQVDYDGKFDYSNIVVVLNRLDYDVKVYPSPASEVISVRVDFNGEAVVRILNKDGSLLKSESFEDEVDIDVVDLPQGLYFVKISLGVDSRTRKIEIVR